MSASSYLPPPPAPVLLAFEKKKLLRQRQRQAKQQEAARRLQNGSRKRDSSCTTRSASSQPPLPLSLPHAPSSSSPASRSLPLRARHLSPASKNGSHLSLNKEDEATLSPARTPSSSSSLRPPPPPPTATTTAAKKAAAPPANLSLRAGKRRLSSQEKRERGRGRTRRSVSKNHAGLPLPQKLRPSPPSPSCTPRHSRDGSTSEGRSRGRTCIAKNDADTVLSSTHRGSRAVPPPALSRSIGGEEEGEDTLLDNKTRGPSRRRAEPEARRRQSRSVSGGERRGDGEIFPRAETSSYQYGGREEKFSLSKPRPVEEEGEAPTSTTIRGARNRSSRKRVRSKEADSPVSGMTEQSQDGGDVVDENDPRARGFFSRIASSSSSRRGQEERSPTSPRERGGERKEAIMRRRDKKQTKTAREEDAGGGVLFSRAVDAKEVRGMNGKRSHGGEFAENLPLFREELEIPLPPEVDMSHAKRTTRGKEKHKDFRSVPPRSEEEDASEAVLPPAQKSPAGSRRKEKRDGGGGGAAGAAVEPMKIRKDEALLRTSSSTSRGRPESEGGSNEVERTAGRGRGGGGGERRTNDKENSVVIRRGGGSRENEVRPRVRIPGESGRNILSPSSPPPPRGAFSTKRRPQARPPSPPPSSHFRVGTRELPSSAATLSRSLRLVECPPPSSSPVRVLDARRGGDEGDLVVHSAHKKREEKMMMAGRHQKYHRHLSGSHASSSPLLRGSVVPSVRKHSSSPIGRRRETTLLDSPLLSTMKGGGRERRGGGGEEEEEMRMEEEKVNFFLARSDGDRNRRGSSISSRRQSGRGIMPTSSASSASPEVACRRHHSSLRRLPAVEEERRGSRSEHRMRGAAGEDDGGEEEERGGGGEDEEDGHRGGTRGAVRVGGVGGGRGGDEGTGRKTRREGRRQRERGSGLGDFLMEEGNVGEDDQEICEEDRRERLVYRKDVKSLRSIDKRERRRRRNSSTITEGDDNDVGEVYIHPHDHYHYRKEASRRRRGLEEGRLLSASSNRLLSPLRTPPPHPARSQLSSSSDHLRELTKRKFSSSSPLKSPSRQHPVPHHASSSFSSSFSSAEVLVKKPFPEGVGASSNLDAVRFLERSGSSHSLSSPSHSSVTLRRSRTPPPLPSSTFSGSTAGLSPHAASTLPQLPPQPSFTLHSTEPSSANVLVTTSSPRKGFLSRTPTEAILHAASPLRSLSGLKTVETRDKHLKKRTPSLGGGRGGEEKPSSSHLSHPGPGGRREEGVPLSTAPLGDVALGNSGRSAGLTRSESLAELPVKGRFTDSGKAQEGERQRLQHQSRVFSASSPYSGHGHPHLLSPIKESSISAVPVVMQGGVVQEEPTVRTNRSRSDRAARVDGGQRMEEEEGEEKNGRTTRRRDTRGEDSSHRSHSNYEKQSLDRGDVRRFIAAPTGAADVAESSTQALLPEIRARRHSLGGVRKTRQDAFSASSELMGDGERARERGGGGGGGGRGADGTSLRDGERTEGGERHTSKMALSTPPRLRLQQLHLDQGIKIDRECMRFNAVDARVILSAERRSKAGVSQRQSGVEEEDDEQEETARRRKKMMPGDGRGGRDEEDQGLSQEMRGEGGQVQGERKEGDSPSNAASAETKAGRRQNGHDGGGAHQSKLHCEEKGVEEEEEEKKKERNRSSAERDLPCHSRRSKRSPYAGGDSVLFPQPPVTPDCASVLLQQKRERQRRRLERRERERRLLAEKLSGQKSDGPSLLNPPSDPASFAFFWLDNSPHLTKGRRGGGGEDREQGDGEGHRERSAQLLTSPFSPSSSSSCVPSTALVDGKENSANRKTEQVARPPRTEDAVPLSLRGDCIGEDIFLSRDERKESLMRGAGAQSEKREVSPSPPAAAVPRPAFSGDRVSSRRRGSCRNDDHAHGLAEQGEPSEGRHMSPRGGRGEGGKSQGAAREGERERGREEGGGGSRSVGSTAATSASNTEMSVESGGSSANWLTSEGGRLLFLAGPFSNGRATTGSMGRAIRTGDEPDDGGVQGCPPSSSSLPPQPRVVLAQRQTPPHINSKANDTTWLLLHHIRGGSIVDGLSSDVLGEVGRPRNVQERERTGVMTEERREKGYVSTCRRVVGEGGRDEGRAKNSGEVYRPFYDSWADPSLLLLREQNHPHQPQGGGERVDQRIADSPRHLIGAGGVPSSYSDTDRRSPPVADGRENKVEGGLFVSPPLLSSSSAKEDDGREAPEEGKRMEESHSTVARRTREEEKSLERIRGYSSAGRHSGPLVESSSLLLTPTFPLPPSFSACSSSPSPLPAPPPSSSSSCLPLPGALSPPFHRHPHVCSSQSFSSPRLYSSSSSLPGVTVVGDAENLQHSGDARLLLLPQLAPPHVPNSSTTAVGRTEEEERRRGGGEGGGGGHQTSFPPAFSSSPQGGDSSDERDMWMKAIVFEALQSRASSFRVKLPPPAPLFDAASAVEGNNGGGGEEEDEEEQEDHVEDDDKDDGSREAYYRQEASRQILAAVRNFLSYLSSPASSSESFRTFSSRSSSSSSPSSPPLPPSPSVRELRRLLSAPAPALPRLSAEDGEGEDRNVSVHASDSQQAPSSSSPPPPLVIGGDGRRQTAFAHVPLSPSSSSSLLLARLAPSQKSPAELHVFAAFFQPLLQAVERATTRSELERVVAAFPLTAGCSDTRKDILVAFAERVAKSALRETRRHFGQIAVYIHQRAQWLLEDHQTRVAHRQRLEALRREEERQVDLHRREWNTLRLIASRRLEDLRVAHELLERHHQQQQQVGGGAAQPAAAVPPAPPVAAAAAGGGGGGLESAEGKLKVSSADANRGDAVASKNVAFSEPTKEQGEGKEEERAAHEDEERREGGEEEKRENMNNNNNSVRKEEAEDAKTTIPGDHDGNKEEEDCLLSKPRTLDQIKHALAGCDGEAERIEEEEKARALSLKRKHLRRLRVALHEGITRGRQMLQALECQRKQVLVMAQVLHRVVLPHVDDKKLLLQLQKRHESPRSPSSWSSSSSSSSSSTRAPQGREDHTLSLNHSREDRSSSSAGVFSSSFRGEQSQLLQGEEEERVNRPAGSLSSSFQEERTPSRLYQEEEEKTKTKKKKEASGEGGLEKDGRKSTKAVPEERKGGSTKASSPLRGFRPLLQSPRLQSLLPSLLVDQLPPLPPSRRFSLASLMGDRSVLEEEDEGHADATAPAAEWRSRALGPVEGQGEEKSGRRAREKEKRVSDFLLKDRCRQNDGNVAERITGEEPEKDDEEEERKEKEKETGGVWRWGQEEDGGEEEEEEERGLLESFGFSVDAAERQGGATWGGRGRPLTLSDLNSPQQGEEDVEMDDGGPVESKASQKKRKKIPEDAGKKRERDESRGGRADEHEGGRSKAKPAEPPEEEQEESRLLVRSMNDDSIKKNELKRSLLLQGGLNSSAGHERRVVSETRQGTDAFSGVMTAQRHLKEASPPPPLLLVVSSATPSASSPLLGRRRRGGGGGGEREEREEAGKEGSLRRHDHSEEGKKKARVDGDGKRFVSTDTSLIGGPEALPLSSSFASSVMRRTQVGGRKGNRTEGDELGGEDEKTERESKKQHNGDSQKNSGLFRGGGRQIGLSRKTAFLRMGAGEEERGGGGGGGRGERRRREAEEEAEESFCLRSLASSRKRV